MKSRIILLSAQDAMDTMKAIDFPYQTAILDPWYNKGIGGVQDNYYDWLFELIKITSKYANHIFIWGFPEIVHKVLDHIPNNFEYIAWLTWYYKNCPSIIKGWRSSQNACIHIGRKGTKLFPKNFFLD